MGGIQSTTKDMLGAVSPWNSIVHVKNSTTTPVVVLLAHDPSEPSHVDAARYKVPANDSLSISSGYLNEPRATLIIRTGLHEAKIFRVPNGGRLLVSLARQGLKVETVDDVEVSDYPKPFAVEGKDTVPMLMRGESFQADRCANSIDSSTAAGVIQSTAKDMFGAVSPWNSIVHVKNSTQTPVVVLLAHNPKEPSHNDAAHYEVPANDSLSISSGYMHEPRATLIMRTGLDEAKVFRVPNAGRLLVSLVPHGLKVDTTDAVETSDYANPQAVAGHDTVPMLLRGESFSVPDVGSVNSSGTYPSAVLLGREQPTASLSEFSECKSRVSPQVARMEELEEQPVFQRQVSKLDAPFGLEQ